MNPKMFEIRDRSTFIPVMAMLINPMMLNKEDLYLFRRAGFGSGAFVQLTSFNNNQSCFDPYDWNSRTYKVAHDHMITNWNSLKTGDVIDVEFILGETTEKKISERFL